MPSCCGSRQPGCGSRWPWWGCRIDLPHIGFHGYAEPTREQIRERMWARFGKGSHLMRYSFFIPAEPGTTFTHDAANSLIGQAPRFTMRESEGGPVTRELGAGRVVAAHVVEEGTALHVTIESGSYAWNPVVPTEQYVDSESEAIRNDEAGVSGYEL